MANPLGITRTFSRIVEVAAFVGTPFLRVLDALYGLLTKGNLPSSKAVVAPVAPEASSPAGTQPPRAAKSDDRAPRQSRASSPPEREKQVSVAGRHGFPPISAPGEASLAGQAG